MGLSSNIVGVAEWLRQRPAKLLYIGSNPISDSRIPERVTPPFMPGTRPVLGAPGDFFEG